MSIDEENGMVREISKGLLRWYEFKEGTRILYLGKPQEALAELLTDRGLFTVCREPLESIEESWAEKHRGCFQYVVAIVKLEEQQDPVRMLKAWRELLGPDGRLLLGMNNRLGLRYFCGDTDPYTDRNFDGIDNYRDSNWETGQKWKGRCYSRYEIQEMLRESGYPTVKLFSVLPDLEHPQLVYGENTLPNEELSSRLFPMYHNPGPVFLKEEYLYTDLVENGMFHAMANAYLAECPMDGNCSDVEHVTLASERGESDACMTILHKNGIVEKRAIYPQGKRRITEIAQNLTALRSRGIGTVDFEIRNDRLLMPFVTAENVQVYLKRLLLTDRELFVEAVDRFRDMILASSEYVPGEGEDGIILRRGYLDLVPLNSFYLDGKYVVYDQEFCMENCPANLVVMRMLCSLYFGNEDMEKLQPVKFFFDRYGITPRLDYWKKMELDFIIELRRERELSNYHVRSRRNDALVKGNRQRMNYSEQEYQRRFVDVFRNTQKRELILFGSGKVAAYFLSMYRHVHEISCVLDNDKRKWGSRLDGIPIQSPCSLQKKQSGDYHVMICVRDYLPIMRQLEEMGIDDYSVYEPGRDYPGISKPAFPG